MVGAVNTGQNGPAQCTGPAANWLVGSSLADVQSLAGRLALLAEEVDGASSRLQGAASLEWQSMAAEAFRSECQSKMGELSTVSAQVRDASAAVAAYARMLGTMAAAGMGG